MSLNTAHIDGGVLIHQGEMILLHAPQAVVNFSGNDDLKKFGEKIGNAYLTSHRLIFIAKKNSQNFNSFSFPFVALSEVDVEQPLFGANCLRGKVRAQENGGWRGEAKFKMAFKAGGAIEFATGMMRAIQLAKQMSSNQAFWNAPPPAYADVTGGNVGPAPQNYYQPQSNYYGWAPPTYNFPAPEPGTVYMSEQPPPYPGIGGFNGAYQAPPAYNPYDPLLPQQPQQQYAPGFNIPATNGNPSPAPGGFVPNGVAYSDVNGGGNVYVPTNSSNASGFAPPPYMNNPQNKKND